MRADRARPGRTKGEADDATFHRRIELKVGEGVGVTGDLEDLPVMIRHHAVDGRLWAWRLSLAPPTMSIVR